MVGFEKGGEVLKKRKEVCLKVESLGYGVKSQEQVGERVEAEDLYKDAVRVTLGRHQWAIQITVSLRCCSQ